MAFNSDDKTLPLVVHLLMLLSVATGFTALVALLISHMGKKYATGNHKSHYEFVFHTAGVFSITFLMLMAFAWFYIQSPMAFVPPLASLLYLLVSVWVVVRSIIGIMRLTGGDGIINPHTLLLPTHPKFANKNPA